MSKTEDISVGAVEKYFITSKRVVAKIPKGDKEAIWDGNIYLYDKPKKPDESHPKRDNPAKIPTQVKGKWVKNFSNEIGKKDYEKADIHAYYKDGGVVLFLAEIMRDTLETKLFYKIMLPYDLKVLLNAKKTNKGYIRVNHNLLQSIDNKRFDNILVDFVKQKKMQISVVDNDLKMEDAKELIITKAYYDGGVKENFLGQEVFIYGKGNLNDVIPLVVNKVKISEMLEGVDRIIRTDNKVYFRHIINHISDSNENYTTYDDIIKNNY